MIHKYKVHTFVYSPHKDVIQRVSFLKNTNRYIAISKVSVYQLWSLVIQGPVVQTIVSITSLLRGQLVKCSTLL